MVEFKKGDKVICINDDCVDKGFIKSSFMKKGWIATVDAVGKSAITLEKNKYSINFKPSAFKLYNKQIELW